MSRASETHRKDEPVKEHGRKVHRPRPMSEVKMRGRKGVRGPREAQKRNETVRRDGRHAAGRYERRERDLARQDRAQQHRRKHEHDRHRVPGLSVAVHASHPAGEREHAIARDGEEKPRRCHHGYASILRPMRGVQDRNIRVTSAPR
jgi:hypothetical protein